MRKLRFRAWDKWKKDHNTQHRGFYYFDLKDVYDEMIDGDDIEITQFIGLLDKNGKEIFEGDILKARNLDGSKTMISMVKYSNRSFVALGDEEDDDDILYFVPNCMEIIGNIYENPELLANLDT